MPRLVDYAIVLKTAVTAGLRSVYPNGAAFVLNTDPAHVAGWAAGEDRTILPEMRERLRVTDEPLAALAGRAWRDLFPESQEAWLAPVHHWAAELEHGEGPWMKSLLTELGLDAERLRTRHKADAVGFGAWEADRFEAALGRIVRNLWKSDFALLFPGSAVYCAVHHHGQLWWQCREPGTADALLRMAE